jgi:hypothetical protein
VGLVLVFGVVLVIDLDAVGFVLEFVDDEFAALVELLDFAFEGLGLFAGCGVGSDLGWVGRGFGRVISCGLWRGLRVKPGVFDGIGQL